jgi:hypothetical protein
MAMGKDAAGHWVAEHHLETFGFSFYGELLYGGRFAPAYELNPLMDKFLIKTHDGSHGPVEIRNTDFSAKAFSSPYTTEIKGIMFLEIQVQQIQNSKWFIGHALSYIGYELFE